MYVCMNMLCLAMLSLVMVCATISLVVQKKGLRRHCDLVGKSGERGRAIKKLVGCWKIHLVSYDAMIKDGKTTLVNIS